MLSADECVVFYSSCTLGKTGERTAECAARLGLGRTSVKRTPLGKPYLDGSDVRLSVSHTEGLFLVAFAACPVGIDAEKSDRIVKNAAQIAEKYFSAHERAAANENFNRHFLKMWTRKEALVKLTGEGLSAMKSTDTFDCGKSFLQIETDTHVICLCSDLPIEKIMFRNLD